MKLRHWSRLVILLIAIVVLHSADARVPELLRYQGQLLDDQGRPISGQVDMRFTLYDAPDGGEILWTENQTVDAIGGVFEVMLGGAKKIDPDVVIGPDLWLGIRVDGGAELTPRTQIVSVGYSLKVGSLDGSRGGRLSSDLTVAGDVIVEDTLRLPNGITLRTNVEDLTITAGTSEIVVSPNGSISITSTAVSITSEGDLTLQGNNVYIEAELEAHILAGTDATVEGSSGATLTSGATTTILGSLVEIN